LEKIAGMARKLKTYQTSMGFFDLAIAAPSMKAALESWGAQSNLFHQGFAKQAEDREIIAATMSKPGVVLRRPVGSKGPFKEVADLPTNLPDDKAGSRRAKEPRAEPKKRASGERDEKASRKAVAAIEKERQRRESERRKADAVRAKQHARREKDIAKTELALADAMREHDSRVSSIEAERAALERRLQAEDARWEKQKEKLESALRRARKDH
jgi:colicin import membrane protein